MKTGHGTWGHSAVNLFRNTDKVGLRGCPRPCCRLPTAPALDSWVWRMHVLPGKTEHGELRSASQRKKEEPGTHFIWLMAQGAPFTTLCAKLTVGPWPSHTSAVRS